MKKKNTIRCPYCGAEAKLRPATVVYGEATLNKDSYMYVTDIRCVMLMLLLIAKASSRWEHWQTQN